MDQAEALRLLLEHRAPVLGFLRAIVGAADLAEDLLQDLSILVLRKHAEIPNAEAFPGWIRRAARFEARNRLRKARLVELDDAAVDALEQAWSASHAPDADVRLEHLEACLQRLSGTARTLVDLRYRRGLDCAAVAARLGRPLNTIYVTLTRIHRTLEQCIRDRLATRSEP